MLRLILLATVACMTCAAPTVSNASEITVWDRQIQGKSVIQIDGPIVSGDEDKFRTVSREHSTAFVVLRSNGGQLRPALDMGRLIRLAGYETVVLSQDECASACALIWAAGSTRWLSTEGRVGFHASYRNENGQPVESGVANALIGHYLSVLGYPAKSVVFATSASPTEILWLTRSNSPQSGYSFEALPSEWGGVATLKDDAPPPILLIPPPAKEPERQPNLTVDWTWGHAGPSRKFEITDDNSGEFWHVLIPTIADNDAVLALFERYLENRWVEYARGGGEAAYFDPKSLLVRAGSVLVWVKYANDAKDTSGVFVHKAVNCERRESRTLESFIRDPSGEVTMEIARSDYSANEGISPGSFEEGLWEIVCWKA